MNTLLIAGCTVGGGVVGALLGVTASRVPPASAGGDPEGPLAPTRAGAEPAPAVDEPAHEPPDDEGHGQAELNGRGRAHDRGDERGDERAQGPGRPPEAEEGTWPVPASPVTVVATAAVTALALGLTAARLGAVPELAAYCVLFAGGIAVSVVDIRVGLVPRSILYPTLLLTTVAFAATAAVGGEWRALGDAAIGGAGSFLCFFALWWFYAKGIGFGDVRLVGLLGAGLGWLGLLHLYVGYLAAFLLGSLYGLAIMVATGQRGKTRLPFAPALVAGTFIGVLWGTTILNAYSNWYH